MAGTLTIKNWDRWQTYRKDRGQPPWIKIHRALMRNPEWVDLTDAQRGQLVVIWLLAADHDGVIPASPCLLKKLGYMENEPDLNLFIRLGFIEHDASVTPECQSTAPAWRQHDAPETEAETEAETEKSRGADAPAANGQYAWAGKVINLNAENYAEWVKAFSHLDLPAELLARDAWLVDHPESRKSWFVSTSKYLANRNMEARAKGRTGRPADLEFAGCIPIELDQ